MRIVETDPFGGGFWITAMLFSTLVPTVLHLGFALYSVMRFPGRLEIRDHSRALVESVLNGEKERLTERERRGIARYLVHRPVGIALLTLAVAALLLMLWVTVGSSLAGNPLLHIARHAVSFVDGV